MALLTPPAPRLLSAFMIWLAPRKPDSLLTLEQQQEAMQIRMADQERRLQTLRAEVRLIRHEVDELGDGND